MRYLSRSDIRAHLRNRRATVLIAKGGTLASGAHDLRGVDVSSSLRVFGDVAISGQVHALRRGVDIVIATPGRLLDHLKRRTRLVGDQHRSR